MTSSASLPTYLDPAGIRTALGSVLVANRGEIALRVIRTARDLGLRTIAIYTDVDAAAPHVRVADQAVRVGSYLDIDAVIAAARSVGADAIHPGYGFLSERSAFAQAVADAGIVLVGPSAEVMDRMGRKDRAREIAIAAGVPVVPSFALDEEIPASAYPVLVKAAAGGGGKGMRVVEHPEDLPAAQEAASREAAAAFGDATLLIEKYVASGRHIEVQIVGDSHGTVVHCFERDCSTQRRHQKVLEEAPAPTLTPAQRAAVTEAGAALARQVGYVNAGTVEFLLDNATGEFYFLEMNTRLQVEHPVTELAVAIGSAGSHESLDLVGVQLQVAAGLPLPFAQDEVHLIGHAIEARVYAEDSYAGFLPQAGQAGLVRWPDGVRVDAALETGQAVSTAYDPMLGKVIAAGADRESARRRLVDGLARTVISGLTTNTGFLRWLAATEEFAAASIDTAWLDRVDLPGPEPDDQTQALLAAWWRRGAVQAAADPADPFRPDGWRIGGRRGPLVLDGEQVAPAFDGPIDGPFDGTRVSALVCPAAPADPWLVQLSSSDRESRHWVWGRSDRSVVELVVDGQRFLRPIQDPTADHAVVSDGALLAPMPGTILAVDVTVGDRVEAGQRLGVLEAMKMELALTAPFDGVVTVVGAETASQVLLQQVLFVVEGDEASNEARDD